MAGFARISVIPVLQAQLDNRRVLAVLATWNPDPDPPSDPNDRSLYEARPYRNG